MSKFVLTPLQIRQFLWIAGFMALLLQVVKAVSTGFWLDEAWIARPIHSYLDGYGWQRMISAPGEVFRGVYFDNEIISNGPTILVPALFLSLLTGAIRPPILHLFAVAHFLLLYPILRNIKQPNPLDVICLFLVVIASTPHIYFTHFLGECPGAFWFSFGLSLIARAFTNSSDQKLLWLGGIALGFAFLAKLVFLIAMIPIVALLLYQKRSQLSWVFKLVLAAIFPTVLWHAYQLIHVGGWEAYREVQMRNFEFASNPLMGSGLHDVKTIRQIWDDFLELCRAGRGFVIVLACLCLSARQLKIHKGVCKLWIVYSWLATASGLLWWLLIANFKFHGQGALLRHSTGFVCIGLIFSCVWIYNFASSLLWKYKNKKFFFVTSFILLSCFSFVMLKCCYKYIYLNKGYGIYSSWKDQKQLSHWIDRYGSTNQLLPIINCDPKLSDSLMVSHVSVPQEVLGSGLFKVYDCDQNQIPSLASKGPIVVLNGELGKLNMQTLGLSLKEGDPLKEGLWEAV